MSEENMATRKRINESLHPIEIQKLDEIADEYEETRSGMLTRIIQTFPKCPEKKHKDKK